MTTIATIKPPDVLVSPIGFLEYGKEFYEAFTSFKPKNKYSPSSYYLICHALELLFKAYLLTKGVNKRTIKHNLGHNLEKILRKSKELQIHLFIELSNAEIVEIKKANSWYVRKGFEYFELRNIIESTSSLPDLEVLSGIAERLIDNLKPLCLEAAKR